ncbi:hypothetical protein B0H13DRAFT_1960478 [Mycena leptocephala]|nr:hypothetical protein B0H13DRAFT_2077501 [Mycena leptocephala]KAJ7930859.1 hypothetical protein B0H13DRAFT_1960478 [Mycena leptocephala]
MEAIRGVIDPVLLQEAGSGALAPTTNGVTTSSSTSPTPAPSPPRSRRFTKTEIAAWPASNYAPIRDANESRQEYETRLTHVTRKDPLCEVCNKLKITVPKTANLERLRRELANYWFTPLSTHRQSALNRNTAPAPAFPRRARATNESDVLPSVLTAPSEPFHFPPVPGALATVSSTIRGELRGSVPLFHIGGPSGASAPSGSLDTSKDNAPKRRKKHRGKTSNTANNLPGSSTQHPETTVTNRNGASTVPVALPSHSTQSSAAAGPSRLSTSRQPQSPSPTPGLGPPFTPTRPPPEASTVQLQASPLVQIVPFQEGDDNENGEAALLRRFDVDGADAYELLGYEDEDDEEDTAVGTGGDASSSQSSSSSDDDEEDTHWTAEQKKAFRIRTRVDAAKRTEGNRRAGGRKTQNAMVRAWNEFTRNALAAGQIDDTIVDEHALLLYIKFCAERPKRTRKGVEIPGTFVGASHLKKLFFGALRIRKEQDAANPALASKRPAVSVFVYDAIKCRMDESLKRVRAGLVPNEDAPDIRANTWLSQVTEEELERIGQGFLAHSHLRLAIFGHLSWTAQHASGNRGDDFRALKLAEIQWHLLTHPDNRTTMLSILGLQGEEKAGKRGMRTVINPVYTVFIAHLKPEMCPLGAFAFYFHYLYDEKELTKSMDIDWTSNSSWRQIRVLHGPRSPTTPFNEQNMYNMYCRAYKHAGFTSRLKAHLPRHLLGYKQEALGVDAAETSRLGWVRGETYLDTYAPSLPKKAILAAAGYRDDEPYDPIWSNVLVPEHFLKLVCPIAEKVLDNVVGKPNLSGTTNHWQLIVKLRPYLFQCGAAIYQKWPESTIFRLPAFMDPDVRNWMSSTFPSQLSLLQANAGNPVDLQRIQNVFLRVALQEVRTLLGSTDMQLKKLTGLLERRTAVFSPAQGFSASNYHSHALVAAEQSITVDFSDPSLPFQSVGTPRTPRTSMNQTPLMSNQGTPTRNQVLLVEPPVAAYYAAGAPQGIFPPLLGQKSVNWTDIFKLVRQPKMLWSTWGPSKTLEQFDLEELWAAWISGAPENDAAGNATGRMKPPLKLVEQYFQASWRSPDNKKERGSIAKAWERLREIPEWIDHQSNARNISPDIVIAELRAIALAGSATDTPKGLNWLSKDLASRRLDAVRKSKNIMPGASTDTTEAAGSTVDSGASTSTTPALQDTSVARKRSAAVDVRRRKKVKL